MSSNTQQFSSSLGTIEYLDRGSGLPVLYFHGTGAGSDAAELLEQSLIDEGCRLIIPNRPGYAATVLGPIGSADFCGLLARELLDHLSAERVAVVGTSGGGMPAIAFSKLFPERVAALVLQCAQSHAWSRARWLPKGMGPALFMFRQPMFHPILRWINARHARACHANPSRCLEQMAGQRSAEIQCCPQALAKITALTEMTLRCAANPRGIQNDWSILVSDNGVTPGAIEAPTLIVHDQCDPLVPYRHAEWSHACIANSELLDVHVGGHLIWFGKDSDMINHKRVAFIASALAE